MFFEKFFTSKIKESSNKQTTATDVICAYVILKNINNDILTQISVRTKNILKNLYVKNLEEFLLLSENDLKKEKNCGSKSISEIVSIQKILNCKFYNTDNHILLKNKQKIPIKCKQINLQLINFSNRLHNILVKHNIKSINNLLSYTEQDLLRLPNMGKSTFNELVIFLKQKNISLNKEYEWIDTPEEIFKDNLQLFMDELNGIETLIHDDKQQALYNNRLCSKTISTLQDLATQYNITRERIRQIEKNFIERISRIFKRNKPIYDELLEKYGNIISFNIIDLNALEKNKWLFINLLAHGIDNDYTVNYSQKLILKKISLDSIISSIDWAVNRKFSLEDIKSQIRNIISPYTNPKELQNVNLIIQNVVPEILSNYFVLIGNNQFVLSTNIKQKGSSASKKYFSALKINKLSSSNTIYKEKTNESKRVIFFKFAAEFCKSTQSLNNIFTAYTDYLSENGEKFVTKYSMAIQSIYNKLQSDSHFLSSLGKTFRYVNFSQEDIRDILYKLDLGQYSGLEISSRLLYTNHFEIMQQYGIENEYELHNFIKKFSSNIDVSRMPILKFGQTNRKQQILNILSSISPASACEIAEAYEEHYGIKENVFLANYLPLISDYNIYGQYSYNRNVIIEADLNSLKKQLTNDFYLLSDVSKIFYNYYGNNTDYYINKYNMNLLGYTLLSSCIYNNKYSSINEFVVQLLDKEKIINLNNFSDLFRVGSAYNALHQKKYSLEIIEFQPNKLINIKNVDKSSLSIEMLKNFIEKVSHFAKDNFFTISSLYNDGFTYPQLDCLGFDELFFVNILYFSKKFSIKKINGCFLIRAGLASIDMQEFLIALISNIRKININELINYIKDKYNIDIDKYFIVSICNFSNSLYYNDIMEKIYIDYDEYLNDL